MIIINNTDLEHLEILMNKVLRKTANKKELGLDGELIIEEYDIDRVYMKCNDIEYTLRMWCIWNIDKGYAVEWTLFKDVIYIDEQGRKCRQGIRVSDGDTKVIVEK